MYFITFLISFIGFCEAAVRHLDDKTFSSVVDGSTNVLVEFYAVNMFVLFYPVIMLIYPVLHKIWLLPFLFNQPWCGHCKTLKPEWEIAGDTFIDGEDDIVIAAVDATVATASARKFEVQGYPTIKFFPKGSTTPVEYSGARTADSIVQWVNEKVGTKRKVRKAPTAVVELTAGNFDTVVMDPSKHVLVEFFAPWCGHCKSVAPTYEQVGKIFEGDKNVVIAKVDASEESDLAQRFDVSGFPTFKYFPAGTTKDPEPFEEGRLLASFIDFINEKAGTFRNEQGGLRDDAGRIDALDTIIESHNKVIDTSVITKLREAAEGITGTAKDFTKLYLSIAEKIVEKGAAYVDKEINRLLGMVQSGNISAEKKTGFLLRVNILRAFVPKAVV